jgi:4-alpha-glucanotransferase
LEISDMFKRSSGILCPFFSLPGPWGIGCFDGNARRFAEMASKAGFAYWQILPLNPTSVGDSPYQGLSAYAGNPYLIDLQQLYDQNLLTADELRVSHYWDQAAVDYGWLYDTREKLLHAACNRLNDHQRQAVQGFASANQNWLPDYSLFRAIKKSYGDCPWWEWPDSDLRRHEKHALERFAEKNADEINYHLFVQYEFDHQWQSLKSDINAMGVQIIGDMPIYVAHDSADVWARSDLFEMDEDSQLLRIAGVPPDYFSADGQLWGNPLYRWDKMAEDGYSWWIDRIGAALQTNDVLRIDHFRGFESYWAVPYGEKTARNGVWEKGPAMKLFDRILAVFTDAKIIAEDLGDVDDDVRAFLAATGLPGMKVMQFGFDSYSEAGDLPHDHIANSVAYSGTHDNTTTAGWWRSLDPAVANRANKYVRYYARGHHEEYHHQNVNFCRCFLQSLWQSPARLAIAPIQDFLGLDGYARINAPGRPDGNWVFRMTDDQLNAFDVHWAKDLNDIYCRDNTRQAENKPSEDDR